MIKADPTEDLLHIRAWDVISEWLPKAEKDDDDVERVPGGMSILQVIPPNKLPEPVSLVKGSFDLISEVYFKVLQSWSHRNDKLSSLLEWETFYNAAPQSDDVSAYIDAHPERFYIPFKGRLFLGDFLNTIF